MCSPPPIVDAYRPNVRRLVGKKWEDLQHARRAAVEHCSGAALLAAPMAVGDPTLMGPIHLPLK